MSDIALAFNPLTFEADIVLGPSDVQTGDELRTAIIVSLFTEPGWWADLYEPDAIGCRVLELRRAKHTAATLLRARDYCRAALAWLIEDEVASAVDVVTFWQGDLLAIDVTLTRAGGSNRYSFVWNSL